MIDKLTGPLGLGAWRINVIVLYDGGDWSVSYYEAINLLTAERITASTYEGICDKCAEADETQLMIMKGSRWNDKP